MKNNNESVTHQGLKIINELFKHNGKKTIPDVKQICLKAKVNRNTALKYLYKWWEKYQGSGLKMDFTNLYNPMSHLQDNELQHAIISLQCLAKELEIYSSSLNHLSNHTAPLGNFILNALQEIENKLFMTYLCLNELNDGKQRAEKELDHILHENRCLGEKIREIQQIGTKKLEHLHEQLNAKKKQISAANHLIKSLKREKRRPRLKNFYYD